LFAAALTWPRWDRSAGLARTAEGVQRAARGRRALLESELAGEVFGLRAEATRLASAARRFREDARSASSDLVRIATAGYQGGEMNVLELLDAYRGAADDELTALDLELSARRARIELDRTTAVEAR
jgi:cobalt-zinc-cadmium efflux system outer membrane protein